MECRYKFVPEGNFVVSLFGTTDARFEVTIPYYVEQEECFEEAEQRRTLPDRESKAC